ncbi:DNA translocase FtsK [Mucispirillum schaedleri]|uniref:DNA translocase FtsK n=1 Tax=Mucispirillum schaedleri TaxID=248039 RepID=UPI001F5721DE|nr:DNA translocase FtsK [Mucispirillum schaedleri]
MNKRKNTVKKNTVKQDKNDKGISSDILLLFFGLIAVFFMLSLLSYSEQDPGYSTIEFSKYNDVRAENLFGKAGAYAADFLGLYFGWTALFIPFLSIYISVLLYRYKKGLTFMLSPILGFIYGMGVIINIAIISGLIGGMDFYFTKQPSGATLGALGSSFILSFMGRVGGIIVFSFITVAFSMLLFSISFSDMGYGFRMLFTYIKKFILFVKSLFNRENKKEEYIEDDKEIYDEEYEEKPSLIKRITSLFKREKEEKAENIENSVTSLQLYEKQPEQLLDKDELEAISNIKFLNSSEETLIEKDDNNYIIDIEPEKETIHFENEIKEYVEEETAPVEELEEKVIEYKEPLIKQAYSTDKNEVKTLEDEYIEIREMETAKKAFITLYNIPLSILKDSVNNIYIASAEEMKAQGDILTQKLLDFGISGVVRAIQPGPVVTMFEFEPVAGTRVSKIASLESDLALSMSALSIRIIAPIPGKNAVGIEIPNKNRQSVSIKELLQTSEFKNSKSPLTVALGKDVIGRPYMSDIRKMPHLLVAGTTGSGKSVGINTMICSILYKSSPDEVKFIMIDPKMVELSIYDGIPHLMAPVVTDTRLAASVLKNVVAEMTRRYTLLAEKKVRNLDGYNEIIKDDEQAEKMPYLVVIVDEFADLMMVAGKDVEMSIARIAQMARAVGIHLIIATQRPTTNVITGLIKANMPARLSFKVSQKNDSRVIIDQNGADTLLGMGDSLFIPPGTSDALRIHGAFVSDDEVRAIVEYLHEQYGEPEYNMAMVQEVRENGTAGEDEDEDVLYQQAVDAVMDKGTASISMIQRMFKIGYNRAARIVEMMEARGILEPSDGTAKPRKVIRR